MPTLGLFETRTDLKPRSHASPGAGGRRTGRAQPIVDYSRLRQSGCDGCPLLTGDVHTPRMRPTGSKAPEIYALGEAPGETEDEQGVPFVGRSGQLLREMLDEAELDETTIRWGNCCRCRPPGNRTPLREEWERCRLGVAADIERRKPVVLLAVGAVALQWVLEETTITRWNGRFVPVRVGKHACWCYPILHPAFVLRSRDEDGWRQALRVDLRRLRQRLTGGLGSSRPETPDSLSAGVEHARDAQGLGRLARQLARWGEERAVVAFDIETDGLRPFSHRDPVNGWLSIAFSDGTVTWAVPVAHNGANWSADERERVLKVVHAFLRGRALKVAHNLPFELEWLTAIYGHEPRWRRTGWGDTMAQAYVLDERRGGHSLDFVVLHRLGFRLKAQSGVDRSRLAELDVGRLLAYNALDAKYTARVFHAQLEDVERDKLQAVYKLHVARSLTLVKAQQAGLVVDFDCVERFCADVKGRIERCRRRIADAPEAKLYKAQTGQELSPTSPVQLAKLFRDMLKRPEGKTGKNKSGYCVDDEVLTSMKLSLADAVLELRGLSKIDGTYLRGCERGGKLVYPDGRLHTKLNDTFTATGRLSSEDPNIQNFPKREDAWVRSIVVPPPGHVLASFDYGQIEYRVIGIASQDEVILKSLRDRYDVHRDWAERVARADPKVWRAFGRDIKKLRSEIKNTWVFPAFYGAHSDYIARMIGMDVRKARALFDEFWDEFHGVAAWQNRMVKRYERDGYVSCLTGRRRRAPLTRNMVLNAPIQGSASDIVVDVMNRLSVRADREHEPALQAVMNIHDDLTFYLPRNRQDELVGTIVGEMLRPAFDWVTVPISIEVSVGDDWGKLESVGTFFSDDK